MSFALEKLGETIPKMLETVMQKIEDRMMFLIRRPFIPECSEFKGMLPSHVPRECGKHLYAEAASWGWMQALNTDVVLPRIFSPCKTLHPTSRRGLWIQGDIHCIGSF